MSAKDTFRMPKNVKITGRTSSITNSFVNGIIPFIEPNEKEIEKALQILGMDEHTICCAYCGDTFTEWDHFRPLVKNKRPTGYISEIHNLVPACGKCNESKGNYYWKDWIHGYAKLSPKSRNIKDLEYRIKRLEAFEKWEEPIKVDFEEIAGKVKWVQHWNNCEQIHKLMQESRKLSDEIKDLVEIALKSNMIKGTDENKIEGNKKKNIFDHFTNKVIKNANNKEISYSLPGNYKEKKVGIIAQSVFAQLLESGTIPREVIEFLLKEEYSKQMLDINFSILKKFNQKQDAKEQRIDHLGRDRYYVNPILINGEKYFLTSQWYDRNKPYLIRWIERYAGH